MQVVFGREQWNRTSSTPIWKIWSLQIVSTWANPLGQFCAMQGQPPQCKVQARVGWYNRG
jgi:hypothetical protein